MSSSDKKILLVEDDDVDVYVLERLLRKLKMDYPIIRARNGVEALEVLRPAGEDQGLESPFIMLVDINMPVMNGFELLEELIDDKRFSEVPIYIVSTSESGEDKNRSKQFQVRGHVVKPVSKSMMLNILEEREIDY